MKKCLLTLMLVFLLNTPAAAAEIVIKSADITEDNTVHMELDVKDPVPDQQITLTAVRYEKGETDFNDIVYIDQKSHTENFDFSYGDWADPDAVYVLRLGGTDIDTPLIFFFEGGDDAILYGDVDLDGDITSADAAMTLQYVLKKTAFSLSPKQLKAASVMCNDEITASDAAAILQKVLKKTFILPVEQIKS